MTQVWKGDKAIAVTPVLASPCVVSQVKTQEKDSYEALQLAYGIRKEKNIKKPQLGHFKKTGVKPAHVREFRIPGSDTFKIGDVVSVETFSEGDIINVTGVSKGKGFQGVVKRHGFHGFRKTHGNKDQERMPGSIGPKGPAHVFKGTKMGGRMGGERVTTTNLEIISINSEDNIIYIKGAVPGAINGLVMIAGKGNLQVNLKKEIVQTENGSVNNDENTEDKLASEKKTEVTSDIEIETGNSDGEVKSDNSENIEKEIKAEIVVEEKPIIKTPVEVEEVKA